MFRPRFAPLAASLAVGVVALAGCGDSSGSGDAKADTGPLASVKVDGTDPAKEPTVTLGTKPLKLTGETKRVITEGKGKAAGKTDMVAIKAQIINGTDGKVATSTWKEENPALGIDLTDEKMLPLFKTQLPGAKEGARLLIGAPTSDVYGPEGNTGLNLKPEDPIMFVVDVVKVVSPLKEAEGAAVAPKSGLPTAKTTLGKPAVITVPKTTAPKALVNQPLITGKGDKVTAGQTLRVAYTGVIWNGGKVFDSSPGYPTPIGVGAVVPGWDKAIVGQTVGSRVLLVVPPADGYGDKGQGEIKGTDTMVFVVDILGAV